MRACCIIVRVFADTVLSPLSYKIKVTEYLDRRRDMAREPHRCVTSQMSNLRYAFPKIIILMINKNIN